MTSPDTPDPVVGVLGEIRDVLREIRDVLPKPAKLPPSAMPTISGPLDRRSPSPRPDRSNS